MLQRLEVVFGLAGTALGWFRSFLTDRTQQVSYTVDACRRRSVFCSACRKGRCLAHCCRPMLLIYTVELEQIVARHDQRLHMYADHCQVYLSTHVH